MLPVMEPVAVLAGLIEKITGLPEAPPVATSGMVRPALYVTGVVGWVKLMACGALLTTRLR